MISLPAPHLSPCFQCKIILYYHTYDTNISLSLSALYLSLVFFYSSTHTHSHFQVFRHTHTLMQSLITFTHTHTLTHSLTSTIQLAVSRPFVLCSLQTILDRRYTGDAVKILNCTVGINGGRNQLRIIRGECEARHNERMRFVLNNLR